MIDVYVGLGSNVDPERHLSLGIELLRQHGQAFLLSSMYEGPAIGVNGADFVNAAARFQWQQDFAALTDLVAHIHQQAGRADAERAQDGRSLDIDIELFGSAVDAPNRLPREDVLAYDFVLGPMAELAPELPHPVLGTTMAALWAPREGATALRCLGDYVQP